ncbi:MAG: MFS transporter, partial [Alphaproteobacteria bacterium]
MPEPLAASSSRLTRQRSFMLFWCARTLSNAAFMMQGVAIGWQIYDLTGDAMDLGLVGLVQFFPVVVFSLVIGQIADRFDRRLVAGSCQVAKELAAFALALGSANAWLGRDSMLALVLLSATARAFETPAMHALLPGLVPPVLLPRA